MNVPAAAQTKRNLLPGGLNRYDVPSTDFKWHQLVAPAVFIGAGAYGVRNNWLHSLNRSVRDGISQEKGRRTNADDYLEYLPLAAYWGMGAIGAPAKNNFKNRSIVGVTSFFINGLIVNGIKFIVKEERPDGSDRRSFPSGHASVAFMGAEMIRKEYGLKYGLGAYAVASGVAFLRLYNDEHWLNDVAAGAGIGILSANLAYWLLPLEYRIFPGNRLKKKKMHADRRSYNRDITALPYYDIRSASLCGKVAFRF